jgi:hypothetical protein
VALNGISWFRFLTFGFKYQATLGMCWTRSHIVALSSFALTKDTQQARMVATDRATLSTRSSLRGSFETWSMTRAITRCREETCPPVARRQ